MWLDILTLPEARRYPPVHMEPPALLKVLRQCGLRVPANVRLYEGGKHVREVRMRRLVSFS